MRAWMVRVGSLGERERLALDEGCVVIGWSEVADLSLSTNRISIQKQLSEAYPDAGKRALGNWTGQLDRFVNQIEVGDIIALPLKSTAGIALGVATSDYSYDDTDPDYPHRRSVEWQQPYIPRTNFGIDLLNSLGSLLTVCELERNDATERLNEMLETGEDPEAPDADADPAIRLSEITASLPHTMPIRDLLGIFQFSRRTIGSVEVIEDALAALGVTTTAPITDGGIDELVTLIDASAESTPLGGGDVLTGETHQAHDTAAGPDEPPETEDPLRIGFPVSRLSSVGRQLVSIELDATLEHAQTIMLQHNYSQLPVVQEEHLVGAVTWESIAIARIGGSPTVVRDALIPSPPNVAQGEDVLNILTSIEQHGYVLVSGAQGKLIGIVTVADLAAEFGRDRKPLMLIEEIELRLRNAVRMNLTEHDVQKSSVRANSRDRLTLGSYPVLLNEDENWKSIGWTGIERRAVLNLISEAATIRNGLMHFSQDPISPSEMAVLEGLLRLLRAASGTTGR